MLRITVPDRELYNDVTGEFTTIHGAELTLEHSLVSLSKWESKWNIPFLSRKDITDEQTIDYVRCMTITQNVNPDVYAILTPDNVNKVNEYIKAPMTATTFRSNEREKKSREIVTAELIYYWMISLNIPFECQKWHLNRLLTLIKVCSLKNRPAQKMSQKQIANQYASINAQRRKAMQTRG